MRMSWEGALKTKQKCKSPVDYHALPRASSAAHWKWVDGVCSPMGCSYTLCLILWVMIAWKPQRDGMFKLSSPASWGFKVKDNSWASEHNADYARLYIVSLSNQESWFKYHDAWRSNCLPSATGGLRILIFSFFIEIASLCPHYQRNEASFFFYQQ